MNPRHFALLAVLSPLAACGPSVQETPGEETSPCNDGLCLEGLECRSDLCVDPDWEPTTGASTSGPAPDTDDSGTTDPPTPSEPTDEVDILVVMDNSGSMGEEQANLSSGVSGLVQPLVDAGMSVRVAITTTDSGNYWCKGAGVSDPKSGQFVLSSCLGRLGDFYFSGNDTNAETACTDYCTLNGIQIQPTTTAEDATPAARPWIEAGPEGTNLGNGTSVADALHCALPQGINGCGFESPLESMSRALQLTGDTNQDEFGFLRSSAHLAVVFVTDEADCSFNPAHQEIVFGEEGVGNQAFWSLPEVQQSPSSAVCWNAGVECDFGLPTDQCVSADKNVEGGATADASDAALFPVQQYRSQLEALRTQKLAFGADVFTFAITGVHEGYSGSMTYALGPNGSDPESFQARFGIGEGCTSVATEAVPPVRIRELAEGSAWGDNGKLYSVCATDYGPAIADIVGTIVDYTP